MQNYRKDSCENYTHYRKDAYALHRLPVAVQWIAMLLYIAGHVRAAWVDGQ